MALLSANKRKVVIEGPVCDSSQVIGWHLRKMNNQTDAEPKPPIHISSFGFNSSILWDPERWGRPTLEQGTSQALRFGEEAAASSSFPLWFNRNKKLNTVKRNVNREEEEEEGSVRTRKTLSLQDVTSAIFEYDRLKETEKKDEENGVLTVEHGRTNRRDKNDARSKGRFNERGRSSSRPMVDISSKECYYCHEMGHIKAYCKKLKEDLVDFMKSKEKNKGGVNVAAAADSEEYSDEETVVLMVQEEKKDTRDMWVFDSACSEHICTNREWFSKLEKCDKAVYMANNGEEKIEGIGSVKLRLHDGSVKMLGNVRYVPKFARNLISLGKLDSLGYGYSCRGGGLKISKGSMIVMKGVKNSKNLYELIGSTIRGDGSVSSHQIEKKDVDFPTKKKVTFADLVKGWSN
ncbi:Glycosyl transferase, family 43 [Corchorus capsularis]|uniref:Glycosyltransferases n=1 Tax=Corchorus capsularis TaxID=210143 RepID=A0A1R3JAN4_COCAP|nr:Glycosyl transferase, family 43 [Corchorus capsularis]